MFFVFIYCRSSRVKTTEDCFHKLTASCRCAEGLPELYTSTTGVGLGLRRQVTMRKGASGPLFRVERAAYVLGKAGGAGVSYRAQVQIIPSLFCGSDRLVSRW